MTISSAMNVLIKFVISITFSFAFSFSENDDMHPVKWWEGIARKGTSRRNKLDDSKGSTGAGFAAQGCGSRRYIRRRARGRSPPLS